MRLARHSLWLLLAAVLATLTPNASHAQEPPKGEVLKFTFADSKIFPGTTRDYWIYIPQQYTAEKPACVYVNQDGVQWNAPQVFDKLIAAKEMPVTIGVFIQPGRVKALNGEALDRFNRSFEYDGLGDGYARFLLEELLPDVEKQTATDGRAIKLSKNGNDRAIGGSSSGAICAFTAAWERPDAFSRVFSGIGTYVGLRGGNEYSTLVRKVEPKPLRIFLQDGSADLNIYGGDWWMANQALERSLVFAGYEVDHVWGDGGHNGKHGTEVFPDAMRWLWKNYPEPIKAGLGSPQLKEILIPGEDWQLVGDGYKFTEGPAANTKGEIFFNDIPNEKTYRIGIRGKIETFIEGSSRSNGQAIGPDGSLYAVLMGKEQVVKYGAEGKAEVVAEGFRGNDIVALHNGSLYVTQPGWDGKAPSQIWYISPQGEKKVVDSGLIFSNGITVSPDQSLLYVADSRTHWVYSYQIQANGDLAHKQKYYHLHVPDTAEDSGADGMRCDRDGRLWVATKMGLQICDQPGRVNCIVPTPNGKCSNLCFAGDKFDTVYATCGDRVYKRKVKVSGANAFQPPIKPATPRL
ncbi:SMP-30/gluconolactonase/LRE family protein [Anatilimnocola sp. NA78]|uniref:SMP-30/gluconolactonase/LRE family protein n=1 Tax=Anatilimnocola sp. NA78 TaxID=3415683 RepID=UPI003CE5A0DE